MKATNLKTLLDGVAVTENPDAVINEVVTDSRLVGPGKLYVAIIGEKYDGNDFAREALEKGAVAAVVSKPSDCDGELIMVPDTKKALAQIACNYRKMFDIKVVAVTGSVGKTTVKEMTGAILGSYGKTLVTYGNRNNFVGLPLTLLSLSDEDEYAAIEIGMSRPGEVSERSRATLPDVAVINNIGVSHIEFFGTRENIMKAKLEIVEGMKPDGIVVYNGDDGLLSSGVAAIGQKRVSFGIENKDVDVRAININKKTDSTVFTIVDSELGTFDAEIPILGSYNVMNALAAYAATTRLGVPPQVAVDGLLLYVPFGMRTKMVKHNGITVIEDCYNASPDSMRESLKLLSDIVQRGVKIAVLGDMLELGSFSDEAHREVGREAARQGIDILLCCGKKAALIASAAAAAGVTLVQHFDDKLDIAEYLKRTAKEGDGVLFKASRAMEFEKIIENFYK